MCGGGSNLKRDGLGHDHDVHFLPSPDYVILFNLFILSHGNPSNPLHGSPPLSLSVAVEWCVPKINLPFSS